MFKITLRLSEIQSDFELGVPLSIRLRKEHWHYVIVEGVTCSVIDHVHCFDVG